jgi:hypothetical protein
MKRGERDKAKNKRGEGIMRRAKGGNFEED